MYSTLISGPAVRVDFGTTWILVMTSYISLGALVGNSLRPIVCYCVGDVPNTLMISILVRLVVVIRAFRGEVAF